MIDDLLRILPIVGIAVIWYFVGRADGFLAARKGAAWAMLILAASAATSNACDRCGIFGRGCRFQSHHVVQQVAYTPPAVSQSQNFVFNNTFPTGLLTQQGSSVYGYSLAATPYTFDSTAYLDRAARFQELALETAQQGINGFNANAQAATALADAVDRRTKNAMVAIAAINANQQQPSASAANNVQTFTMRATVRDGVLSIENQPPGQTQPTTGNSPPAAFQALGAGSWNAVSALCGKCHDGTGQHHEPKTSDFSGLRVPLDDKLTELAIDKVTSGEMPPKPARPLSDAQKLEVINGLRRMRAFQAE